MGHIGLTPQSVHAMGGYRVQGRTLEAANELLADAEALEEAGVFAIVLEGIPRELAAIITRRLRIPTIGIGAGPDCDGQVLVFHDLAGLSFGSGLNLYAATLTLLEPCARLWRPIETDVTKAAFRAIRSRITGPPPCAGSLKKESTRPGIGPLECGSSSYRLPLAHGKSTLPDKARR